jgi:hypothetical protein
MDVKINTDQIKRLQEYFVELSRIDQKRVLMSGLRKAVKPMVDTAKNIAPYNKGALKGAIGTEEMSGGIGIWVGVRTGGVNKNKVFYGRFFDPSEKAGMPQRRKRIFVSRKKGIRYGANEGWTGKIEVSRFIRDAFVWNEDKMQDILDQSFFEAIEEKTVRLYKKLNK